MFDVDKLDYISSAGLRVLMKFRRKAAKNIIIQNASNDIYDILDMTNITKMFVIKKKLLNISIDGCEQVGTGLSSKVYRIDPETIIKVYDKKIPFYKITREIDLAKKVFIAGLPTAISYDLVRCGDLSLILPFHALVSDQESIQHSLSLSKENILRFWDSLLSNCFHTDDLTELKETFKAFAYLRSALFPIKHVQISEDRKQTPVANARRNFFPNFERAMQQVENLKKFF